jgi:hypothetical protein
MGTKASTVPTLDASAPLDTGKFLATAGLDVSKAPVDVVIAVTNEISRRREEGVSIVADRGVQE